MDTGTSGRWYCQSYYNRGYGRPSGRPRVSHPATYRSGTPRVRSPAVSRWHAHLHGLATAIHETSGLGETIVSGQKEQIEEMVSTLKQLRDELKVQIHLGKAEAKDEWERLEEKWQQFKVHSRSVAEAAGESAKNVSSALEIVGEELKSGYDRIRKLL